MAVEWRETTLGEFITLQRGHDLTESDRRAGDVPVMGSAGQNGFHDTARAKGPGIVVGRSGASFGQVHYSPVDFWPHNTALYVTDFKGNDERFAFYLLKALDFTRYNSGSAQPSLNRNYIYPIPIRIPPPKEQKAIAAVLGALDDKIELNRRMNATLEAIARALFQSWFVDFDPVRAKQEGRPPVGLDEPTAAIFPDQFEQSGLGRIPEGWEVTTLDEMASIRGGKQLPTEECLAAAEFPVFGANGIMGYANQPTHRGFVIAFGRVGAYCGSIHWSLDGAWINNNASSVVPDTWPEYVLQAMLGIDFQSMRTGSAQPFIPNSALAAAKLLRPPEAVARQYCRFVAPLRRKQADNEKQSHALAVLRNALLPRLLSGELKCAAATLSEDRS
jgi:type I restriction enzyme, S subunit